MALAFALCQAHSDASEPSDPTSPTNTPAIEIGHTATGLAKRPITLEDMVSVRQIKEPKQSPDGRSVAFLVTQSFLSCNCEQTAIFIVSIDDTHSPRKIMQEAHITNLQWSPDGQFITFLSAKSGSVQLWRASVETRQSELFLAHRANADLSLQTELTMGSRSPVGILDYQWAPDGSAIAFSVTPSIDRSAKTDAEKHGFLYDDVRMSLLNLLGGDWVSSQHSVEVWIYRLGERKESLVWRTKASASARIGQLVWAKDNRRIAVSYGNQLSPFDDDLGIIDTETGQIEQLLRSVDYVNGIAWSPDGQSLAVLQRSGGKHYGELTLLDSHTVGTERTHNRQVLSRLASGPSIVFWHDTNVYFISPGSAQNLDTSGLYAFDTSSDRSARKTTVGQKVTSCDRPVQGKVACIWQSPSDPPQPALVTLLDGSVKKLYDVNPEFAGIELSPVKELHWTNRFGDRTNGYLLTPVVRGEATRVPLVIMAYGVDGDFVTSAGPALTSYPAQAFARDGFAVLIVNPPVYEEWIGPDFKRGARAWGYSPLASLESIIDELHTKGVIDRSRIGFMGHSWGGFWVQFAASHSNLFRAVELHNGGTSTEPGAYGIMGSKLAREFQNHFMGGGPYPPKYLKNYESLSAAMTARKVKAPVLIECETLTAFTALEYYSALRESGVPVDLYIYPNAGHIFNNPEQLAASMRRNLDWFEYWLAGREHDGPESVSQYARWHAFGAQLSQVRI